MQISLRPCLNMLEKPKISVSWLLNRGNNKENSSWDGEKVAVAA